MDAEDNKQIDEEENGRAIDKVEEYEDADGRGEEKQNKNYIRPKIKNAPMLPTKKTQIMK